MLILKYNFLHMLKTSKKGFTLIELMVVMAIIGVLAVMLVPQLSGAQERARDSGRIAAIQNITAVLETYFSDEGQYPDATHAAGATANGCFSTEDGTVAPDIAALLKWGSAPLDPQTSNNAWGCWTDASFWYKALEKGWVNNSWYVINANVEGWKKANLDWSDADSDTTWEQTSARVAPLTAETSPATDSVYASTN